jgi:hypothetical protein
VPPGPSGFSAASAVAGTDNAGTDSLQTRRWRGMDSNFQFRNPSPPSRAFGDEWRVLDPPQQLYRFAEADDRSDDTVARCWSPSPPRTRSAGLSTRAPAASRTRIRFWSSRLICRDLGAAVCGGA